MIYTIIPHTGTIHSKAWLGELFEHCQLPDPNEREREVNINHNRHETQRLFVASHKCTSDDDILLLDSDVVTDKAGLDDFYAYYLENGRVPLAVDTKDARIPGHVVCACCLISYEAYRKIDYLDRPEECQCLKIPDVSYYDDVRFFELKKSGSVQKTVQLLM